MKKENAAPALLFFVLAAVYLGSLGLMAKRRDVETQDEIRQRIIREINWNRGFMYWGKTNL